MEDGQEKESAGRLQRQILSRLRDSRDSNDKSASLASASSPSVVRIVGLNSMGARDGSADVLLDGPNKYNGRLIEPNFQHRAVVQASNICAARYQFRTSRVPGVQISLRDSERGGGGGGGPFRYSITAADVRALLAGGFAMVLKIGGLLLARAFCDRMWPFLQVFSVCTLSIDPLKLLVIWQLMQSRRDGF